jgi:hypothetical protein
VKQGLRPRVARVLVITSDVLYYLQVTSCFPMPHSSEEDQSGEGNASPAAIFVAAAKTGENYLCHSMDVLVGEEFLWMQ